MLKQLLIGKVLKPIEEAGFQVFFVGGCVRDRLKNVPIKDFDICTNATPEDLHRIFKLVSNVSKNSEEFGVTIILVPVENGTSEFMEVEIATFRSDKTLGRHPQVELGASIESDASRRDFTCNALFEDIQGNIIDPTGQGIEDIKNNVLRFVGDPKSRLQEDPLRIFRFVRFLATKGFESAHSAEEIEEAVKGLDFSEISKERILKEFKQILAGKFFFFPSQAFVMADRGRVFEIVGLESIFKDMQATIQSWRFHVEGSVFLDPDGEKFEVTQRMNLSGCTPISHGTVLSHTLLVLNAMHRIIWEGGFQEGLLVLNACKNSMNFDPSTLKFLLMLAAILHDIGKAHCNAGTKKVNFNFEGLDIVEEVPRVEDHPQVGIEFAEKFCKSLKMSNEETRFICSLVAHHMEVHKLTKHKSFCKILDFVHHPFFEEIVLLAFADETGSIALDESQVDSMTNIFQDERVKEAMFMELPAAVLTGEDLINFGVKPGPIFKKMLQVARKIQIDQGITDKKALFNAVKNIELGKDE